MLTAMRTLLTVGGAARRKQKSEATIRRWAETGQLPVAMRLANGTRLFRESDVDAAPEAGS